MLKLKVRSWVEGVPLSWCRANLLGRYPVKACPGLAVKRTTTFFWAGLSGPRVFEPFDIKLCRNSIQKVKQSNNN